MKTTTQPADQPVTFTLELSEHEMLVIGDALYRLTGGSKTFRKLAPEVQAAVETLASNSERTGVLSESFPIPSNVLARLRRRPSSA